MLATTHWNEGLRRNGDLGCPAQRCSRALGGRTNTTNALNVYLDESNELSHFQLSKFWDLVKMACQVYGYGSGEGFISGKVADAWRDENIRAFSGNSIGLGGMMRVSHVKKLLSDAGKSVHFYCRH